ncbi:MAG: BrnT family toxin [Acidobacteria bacterium]|nr:BrnT family toxin [Acidobacteriota bacterium]
MEDHHGDSEREDGVNLEFEWHSSKATMNLRKHGVSFEEACTVFGDVMYLEVPDQDHSDEESRYLAIGMSSQGRLVTVIFTERGKKLRLISARVSEPWERSEYEA